GQPLADVHGGALLIERASLQRQLANGLPLRLFGHAIQHAAAPTPAKEQGVRALERLHAFDVVQVAENLGVIANAVHEKVGGRAIAAYDDLIAVAFALGDTHARDVANDVTHALHRLIVDERSGHDGC